jgi:hypothetical protein
MMLLLLFALGLTSAPRQGNAEPVRTTAILVTAEAQKDVPYSLRFTVRSLGANPVEVYTYRLPWGSPLSIFMVAVSSDGQCSFPLNPIDDPDIAKTLLAPGTMTSGTVDLKAAFPKLAATAARKEVLVFWSFELVTTSGIKAERTGGGCSFLKGKTHCWNGAPVTLTR